MTITLTYLQGNLARFETNWSQATLYHLNFFKYSKQTKLYTIKGLSCISVLFKSKEIFSLVNNTFPVHSENSTEWKLALRGDMQLFLPNKARKTVLLDYLSLLALVQSLPFHCKGESSWLSCTKHGKAYMQMNL